MDGDKLWWKNRSVDLNMGLPRTVPLISWNCWWRSLDRSHCPAYVSEGLLAWYFVLFTWSERHTVGQLAARSVFFFWLGSIFGHAVTPWIVGRFNLYFHDIYSLLTIWSERHSVCQMHNRSRRLFSLDDYGQSWAALSLLRVRHVNGDTVCQVNRSLDLKKHCDIMVSWPEMVSPHGRTIVLFRDMGKNSLPSVDEQKNHLSCPWYWSRNKCHLTSLATFGHLTMQGWKTWEIGLEEPGWER